MVKIRKIRTGKKKNIELTEETKKALLSAQRSEITEHHVYMKLSEQIGDKKNSALLKRIADDELIHYNFFKSLTGRDVKQNKFSYWKYVFFSRLLGITFSLKSMENGEKNAQLMYDKLSAVIPEIKQIEKDEEIHEHELLNVIDEEKLLYVGSMVLGLNDALVELTGALAGLTLALQDTKKIALAGLITGFAASLSMAASEYLSVKAEGDERNALKASGYTGTAYVFTVIFLVLPYLIFSNYFVCLAVTVANALLIILVFNYYISVAKDLNFKKRFLEMASISLGVAALSFFIGFLIRIILGIDA